MIVVEVCKEMPKSCDKCPLFVKPFGCSAYCKMHADYTDEEIEATEHGREMMFYHGCLPRRPMNCPLQELRGVQHG